MERNDLMLSVVRALLGEVGPNLLGVLQNHISDPPAVTFYFSGDLGADDQDSVDCITTQIVADLAPDEHVEFIVHSNVAERPRSPLGEWVFARRRTRSADATIESSTKDDR